MEKTNTFIRLGFFYCNFYLCSFQFVFLYFYLNLYVFFMAVEFLFIQLKVLIDKFLFVVICQFNHQFKSRTISDLLEEQLNCVWHGALYRTRSRCVGELQAAQFNRFDCTLFYDQFL